MEVWEREGSLFRKKKMGVFKVKKNFGRKMWTTFCGSPVIGMNPPSRPLLRTHLMILVPDCTITKTKLILIPEAEHCGLNYDGFLSLTVMGAKVHLVSDCSVKTHTLSGGISRIVHIWECPPPRSCSKEWSAHIIGRLLSLAGKQNCTTPIS